MTKDLKRFQSVDHYPQQFSGGGQIPTRRRNLLDQTFLIRDALHGRLDFQVDLAQRGTQFGSFHAIPWRVYGSPEVT
ncbi:hypothetical protein CEY04_05285 [Achromobacter sp. HZ28]|nr:hypothetical protein CEY05_05295 [Achromobacter sp. HZ34]OWT81303.1 hypothetical protein CEY04_05285 [Achromobacter sp. HZ28]